jgi:hypothetical protein
VAGQAGAASGDGPSLDELLGLPGEAGEPGESGEAPIEGQAGSGGAEGMGEAEGMARPGEAATPIELDPAVARRLRDEAMSDNPFESALVDMQAAAERLGKSRDAGLGTQRLMQEAIDKLDRVIASAERQQGGGGAGQPQGQRGEDAGGGRMVRQGQGQGRGGLPAEGGDGHGGEASPGGVGATGAAGEPLVESRREWGGLPPRVRRELSEGVNEQISPLYRRLTERYFEVLSEEP